MLLSSNKTEPEEGWFNTSQIQEYRDVIIDFGSQLKEPVLVLQNMNNTPEWFLDIGSFEHSKNAYHFVEYVARITKEFSTIKNIYVFDEINESIIQSYLLGASTPFKKNITLTAQVLTNVMEAYVSSVNKIKVRISPKT
jgi:beta-glucosidase/6-phospho-beta-glucosidase/beta-galactosidase